MLTIVMAHLVVALIAPFGFRALGRNIFYLLAAVPALSFVWLILQYPTIASGAVLHESFAWIPDFGLEVSFRMDQLSWVVSLLVLGVGALVLAYCARYFDPKDGAFKVYGAGFGAQLLAFAGVMFALVVADDLILLFIFWELTTILSYLLIGYNRTRIASRRSALQALIVTTFGGLTMLVGLIILGQAAGTYQISEILNGPPSGVAINVALVLILIGALSKSALVPFHFWLPGAMAAPTPVSAYLHAAAMVKAGVYLVARLAPGFSDNAYWHWVIVIAGLLTMVVGGWRALRQNDIKLILAYGTVSQLGFLTLMVGLGDRASALAGLALLLAHGMFKATLFLVVGIVDHQAGTRDIRKLSGVGRAAPVLCVVGVIGALSMAAVPLTAGFIAKEAVYVALVDRGSVWLLAIVVAGSMLTVAYSARFIWGAFATKVNVETTSFPKPGSSFLAPPAILAVATLIFGVYPAPMETWIKPYAKTFKQLGEHAPHLALFSGFNLPLALSVLTLLVGILLFVFRRQVAQFQELFYPAIDAQRGYQKTIGALDDVAVWVTGRTQRGSLFFYLAVILSTATITYIVALISGRLVPQSVYLIDPNSPAQLVSAVIIIIGALGAARANKRFLAVLMVSVTGYGISLIFALQGAPDLALTQMIVETIVLVAFVLGMRTLPAQLNDRTSGRQRVVRVIISVAFGTTMIFVALAALGSRVANPVSVDFAKLAYDIGGGLNVVNVTLVDIRAWDTFGEISVLAIAATGIASLIFVKNRGGALPRASAVRSGTVGRQPLKNGRTQAELDLAKRFAGEKSDPWLVAGQTLAPERRSIILEVSTRLLFHSMIIISIYLLFAGHNQPGGGFAGGLMAGLALTLRYLAGGRAELAEAARISAGALLGMGLALAVISGVAPVFFGGQVFQSYIWNFALPLFGDVKFVTSTFFDVGVYLVVVGLVLDVLRTLGAEIDRTVEAQRDDSVASGSRSDR